MTRIYKKGKTSLVSSILNILGLTAAFAALYIILVQVHHDLTYNKALKDSDRIYVLTKKDINQSEYSSYMNRPMGEYVISASPDIEAGGCGKIMGNPIAVRVSEDQSPMAITISAMNKGARDVFGFELVTGNWDDLTGTGFALSESAAKRLGVQVGDVMQYYDGSAWQGISIVAILEIGLVKFFWRDKNATNVPRVRTDPPIPDIYQAVKPPIAIRAPTTAVRTYPRLPILPLIGITMLPTLLAL